MCVNDIHIHIIHILRKRWHVSIILFCLVYSPIFSGEPLRLAAKGTDLRRLPKRISCIASFLWAQRRLDATKSGSSPEKNHGNICNLTGFRGIYWWFNGFLFMGKPSGNQTWLAENLPPKWMFLGKTMELNWDLNQRSSNKDQASTTLWADTKCSTDVPSLMGHEFYQQTLWWWVANQQTLQMYPLGIKHGNWKSAINAVWMGKSSINDKWLIFQPATVDYLPTQQ